MHGDPAISWQGDLIHYFTQICCNQHFTAVLAMCTHHCWFVRIGAVPEPYFQLPLSDRRMRCLFPLQLGAHACSMEWTGGCAWHRLPASALSAQGCMWAAICLLRALLAMTFMVSSILFMTERISLVHSAMRTPLGWGQQPS